MERNQSQPTEAVVFQMAKALQYNEDELLAVRGLVAEDLRNIILKQPQTIAALILAVDGMPAPEIEKSFAYKRNFPKIPLKAENL